MGTYTCCISLHDVQHMSCFRKDVGFVAFLCLVLPLIYCTELLLHYGLMLAGLQRIVAECVVLHAGCTHLNGTTSVCQAAIHQLWYELHRGGVGDQQHAPRVGAQGLGIKVLRWFLPAYPGCIHCLYEMFNAPCTGRLRYNTRGSQLQFVTLSGIGWVLLIHRP